MLGRVQPWDPQMEEVIIVQIISNLAQSVSSVKSHWLKPLGELHFVNLYLLNLSLCFSDQWAINVDNQAQLYLALKCDIILIFQIDLDIFLLK